MRFSRFRFFPSSPLTSPRRPKPAPATLLRFLLIHPPPFSGPRSPLPFSVRSNYGFFISIRSNVAAPTLLFPPPPPIEALFRFSVEFSTLTAPSFSPSAPFSFLPPFGSLNDALTDRPPRGLPTLSASLPAGRLSHCFPLSNFEIYLPPLPVCCSEFSLISKLS